MAINIITTISILLVSSILLYLVNKFFKIKKSLKTFLNFTIVIISLPLLLFFGILVVMDYQLDDTRIVEIKSSINCDNENFRFMKQMGKIQYSYIKSDKNDRGVSLTENNNGILGIVFPKYSAYYQADYINSNLNDELNQKLEQINSKQKQSLTILLNCKDYNLDTLYYKDINSLSCYLANYSKATDYPDCSMEIKAKFGLTK